MVELGAGVGAPGLVASILGAQVLLTEQQPLNGLLQRNVNSNAEVLTGIIINTFEINASLKMIPNPIGNFI